MFSFTLDRDIRSQRLFIFHLYGVMSNGSSSQWLHGGTHWGRRRARYLYLRRLRWNPLIPLLRRSDKRARVGS